MYVGQVIEISETSQRSLAWWESFPKNIGCVSPWSKRACMYRHTYIYIYTYINKGINHGMLMHFKVPGDSKGSPCGVSSIA